MGNNPINRVDPDGHAQRCADGDLGGGCGSPGVYILPTPTPTLTPTPTSTPTFTPTPTNTSTSTATSTLGPFYNPGPTSTITPTPTSTLRPITSEDVSQTGKILETGKSFGDSVLGGLEAAKQIKIGLGGVVIGFGVDGVIQYMQDATGSYNTEARIERAFARSVESSLISVPAALMGDLVGVAGGGAGSYGGPPGMVAGTVIGYVAGYSTTSAYLSSLANPIMDNTIFPLFPIFTR